MANFALAETTLQSVELALCVLSSASLCKDAPDRAASLQGRHGGAVFHLQWSGATGLEAPGHVPVVPRRRTLAAVLGQPRRRESLGRAVRKLTREETANVLVRVRLHPQRRIPGAAFHNPEPNAQAHARTRRRRRSMWRRRCGLRGGQRTCHTMGHSRTNHTECHSARIGETVMEIVMGLG